MNPALRRSAAHVFVESLEAPSLDNDDRHHLVSVLRLRSGEPVSASDGLGRWRVCRFGAGGEIDADGDIVAEQSQRAPITIGFAIPKGDRPEWIVQKLTEIGVDHILLVHAERSIVRWDEGKAERQIERLRKVAREASMQSRRVWIPSITGPLTPRTVIAQMPAMAFAEPDGAVISLADPMIMVGPEGGWSPAELAHAPATVSLGPTILRVETAAIVAASQLAAVRDRGLTL